MFEEFIAAQGGICEKNKPILTVYHDNIKVQFIRSNSGGEGGDSVGGFS